MNKYYAKRFLLRVIKHLPEKTNPSIIQQILKDLKIDSFKTQDENFLIFLKKIAEEPISATPLIEAIANGLLKNFTLCRLLDFIERENLISEEELKKMCGVLQAQVNLLCLFEAFAVTMANGYTFNEDIYSFTTKQRYTNNPGNPLCNLLFGTSISNFSLFKNLKMASVDPAMTNGAFVRSLGGDRDLAQDKIKLKSTQFIKKHRLSLWNTKIAPLPKNHKKKDSVNNVGLNILEAAWEEAPNSDGSPGNNAFAGAALITLLERMSPENEDLLKELILPEGADLNKDGGYSKLPDLMVNPLAKITSQFYIRKEWMDFYNSWNLLFIMRNLDSWFLPIKLLVPSVLCALPAQYMETRVFVLYLVGNLFHYNKLRFFPPKVTLANAAKIFEKWGEINREYGDQLLQNFCPDLECTSRDMYYDIFGSNLNCSLAYHVANFVCNFDNFRITSKQPKIHEEEEEVCVTLEKLVDYSLIM